MVENQSFEQNLKENEVIDVEKQVVEFEDMLDPKPEDHLQEIADPEDDV